MSDDRQGVPPPRNDNRPHRGLAAFGQGVAGDIVEGLRFYSRLPIGFVPHGAPQISRIAAVLPAVSLILGIAPAAIMVVLIWSGLPSIYAAGIAVAAWLILTGGMAEDGLADAFDGLFGGPSPEVRLDIMRDSRHGTYGVSALVLMLLLRTLAVGGIAAIHPLAGAAAWLAAGGVSRSASLWLLLALPPARTDGASAAAGRVTPRAFWFGVVVSGILAFLIATPFAGLGGVAIALVLGAVVTVLWTAICRRLIGGQTGDCVGALQALVELALLSMLFAAA